MNATIFVDVGKTCGVGAVSQSPRSKILTIPSSHMSGYVFVVVVNGTPIYEHSVGTVNLPSDGPNSYQFVLHAALDMVEEHLWKTGTMNLKRIDAFQGQNISAYVTASNVVFLLMHERASEDSVGSFMHQVHEMYIKIMMNPFYTHGTVIASGPFDARVHQLMRNIT